jgi:hypothetical protein
MLPEPFPGECSHGTGEEGHQPCCSRKHLRGRRRRCGVGMDLGPTPACRDDSTSTILSITMHQDKGLCVTSVVSVTWVTLGCLSYLTTQCHLTSQCSTPVVAQQVPTLADLGKRASVRVPRSTNKQKVVHPSSHEGRRMAPRTRTCVPRSPSRCDHTSPSTPIGRGIRPTAL